MALSHAQMQSVLGQAGWPVSLLATMSAIGMAESSGRANAGGPSDRSRHKDTNGRWSVGVWQINATEGPAPGTSRNGVSLSQLEDPLTNARVALSIYRSQGLHAWGPYTTGKYKSYLAAAQQAAGGVPVTYTPAAAAGGASSSEPDSSRSAADYIGLALIAAAVLKVLRG